MSQRINQYLARHSELSRRAADAAISEGRVKVNNQPASLGALIEAGDVVSLDGTVLGDAPQSVVVMLNKPVGYVCSRDGQGSPTVYELLPPDLHHLNPVGRLDKNSSGLLLLTNDGQLAQQLTHPSHHKNKLYEVCLHQALTTDDEQQVSQDGVRLRDGISRFQLQPADTDRKDWLVTMQEGRNRQIRRTFAALGYEVIGLHRTNFGDYALGSLEMGHYQII